MYDGVGNRLSLTLNDTVTNYTYDDNDKLLTATSGGNSAAFGYDLAGSMTSVTGNLFGTRTMVYDDASRLTSTTFPGGTDTFTYNGFGQKMGATLEGIARTYAWFGDRLIAEYGCNSCCYAGAIYTDGTYGGLWLGRQMGGQKQYPVYDGIGTVRRVVNENAATLFSNDLDAFGHAIAGSGSATWHPFRFGGAWGYTHMPSGLEQLGARFYWPEVGRFVSQDPMGDGVNWYAYVGDKPTTAIDPKGLRKRTPRGPRWFPGPGGENITTGQEKYGRCVALAQQAVHDCIVDTWKNAAWQAVPLSTFCGAAALLNPWAGLICELIVLADTAGRATGEQDNCYQYGKRLMKRCHRIENTE